MSSASDRGVISPIHSPAATPPAAEPEHAAFSSAHNVTSLPAFISSVASNVSAVPAVTSASVTSTIKVATEPDHSSSVKAASILEYPRQQSEGHKDQKRPKERKHISVDHRSATVQEQTTAGSNSGAMLPRNNVAIVTGKPTVSTISLNRPAGQPTSQPSSLLNPAHSISDVSTHPLTATSPPIIKPSSPAGTQIIAGRENVQRGLANLKDQAGETAVSTPPPTTPFDGPVENDQQANVASNGTTHGSVHYRGMELLPKTHLVTHSQLVNEVKGIYAGLAMVETKCMEIDSEKTAKNGSQDKLEDDQWRALLALHQALLNEYHDFLLATQHPLASPSLRGVAQKYAIPARMWRHGIYTFLEILRHRLPASREYMITFIYMAYQMVGVLYETVPAFEDTWIECLGDLSRYRMAIEEDSLDTRDAWTKVSRHWYSMASGNAPNTGRLYHHLAIIARPYVITQMFYYVKSLCVPTPFASTRESITTVFDPVFKAPMQHLLPVEVAFLRAHAILFKSGLQSTPELAPAVTVLLDGLDAHIALSFRSWTNTGLYMASLNNCAFLNYGGDDNVLVKLLRHSASHSATKDTHKAEPSAQGSQTRVNLPMTVTVAPTSPQPAASLAKSHTDNDPAVADPKILQALEPVQQLVSQIDQVVFARIGDANCHGYIHARLLWMLCMARLPQGMVYLEHGFPWNALVQTLNHLMQSCENYKKVEQPVLMQPQVDKRAVERKLREIQLRHQQQQAAISAGVTGLSVPPRPPNTKIAEPPPARSDELKPLPDDWHLQGFLWANNHFPQGWFSNAETIDDDERLMEVGSTRLKRKERILWMACRLAAFKKWITYDATAHQFEATEAFAHAGAAKLPNSDEVLNEGDGGQASDADYETDDAAGEKDGLQKFKRDEVKG
ncbi:hypothetical protein SEPCBS57363_005661 [Sporothrix epigloea]|uniref:Nonsense-mediated mRNA decay factor n=1 Tax=Sporothrix epigloea TaxID=1892477 RepID=A0ABP0DZ25_9PEZI